MPCETLLRDAQDGHSDQTGRGQDHAEDADLGLGPSDEVADRLERDQWGEDEELNRHEFLSPLLCGMGEKPPAGEAPDDDQAGDALDGRVEAERDQRDRAGQESCRDRDDTLCPHPGKAQP